MTDQPEKERPENQGGEIAESEEESLSPNDAEAAKNSESSESAQEVMLDEEAPDELEQLTAQAAEYLDGWQRARAELANYKKRVERERRDAYSRAAADILSQYLEVVDDLERALQDRPDGSEAASWADGIELVLRKLQTLLESHGVEKIDAISQPFDPKFHDAISHEETDDTPEGHVIDIIKHGYRMGDRVLRAAVVRVAK